MQSHSNRLAFWVAAALCLSPTCFAQAPPSPVAFSGTGKAELQRLPQFMRVAIPIVEDAETMEEALQALKDSADIVRKDLSQQGADPARIIVSSPDIIQPAAAGENMFNMMAAMGGAEQQAPEEDSGVTVRLSIRADFKLKNSELDELLQDVWAIQQAIRDADYDVGADTGGGNLQQQIMQQAMGNGDKQDPDKTGFLFIASVSKAERAALHREAFQKAQIDAAELAAAAGVKLGQLMSVSRGDDINAYTKMMSAYMPSTTSGESRFLQDEEVGLMATGTSPGVVKLQINITAGFAAEKEK